MAIMALDNRDCAGVGYSRAIAKEYASELLLACATDLEAERGGETTQSLRMKTSAQRGVSSHFFNSNFINHVDTMPAEMKGQGTFILIYCFICMVSPSFPLVWCRCFVNIMLTWFLYQIQL